MNHQISLPTVLQHRIWFLLLMGAGCLLIAGLAFFISHDQTLLILSVILSISDFWKAIRLWYTAFSNNYKTITGICTAITPIPFRKYQKYHIIGQNDVEYTLLLEKHTKIKLYVPYCFYFRKDTGYLTSEQLNLLLFTDNFLGFEKLS